MKSTILTILKSFTLFIFWLIFPPIFLVLSIIWKMPKKIWRVVLTIVAPITLLCLFALVFLGYIYYRSYIYRGSQREIETKTGLDLPRYKVVEKRHFTKGTSYFEHFTVEYVIKLDTTNIKEFYRKVEEQIIKYEQANNSNKIGIFWKEIDSGNYYFNSDGFEPLTKETLILKIDKKNAEIRVSYGIW